MEPGTEDIDVDTWDCVCKKCADGTRVWITEILAIAFTPETLQEAINECMTSDQHDRPYLQMEHLAEALRERVLTGVGTETPSYVKIKALLEAQLDADKIEDLLSDEFTDLKWVASHLQDYFKQEILEVLT
jgi:hypothetical protein